MKHQPHLSRNRCNAKHCGGGGGGAGAFGTRSPPPQCLINLALLPYLIFQDQQHFICMFQVIWELILQTDFSSQNTGCYFEFTIPCPAFRELGIHEIQCMKMGISKKNGQKKTQKNAQNHVVKHINKVQGKCGPFYSWWAPLTCFTACKTGRCPQLSYRKDWGELSTDTLMC